MINKIKKFLKILNFLIFKKDNFFRSYFLNNEYFDKITSINKNNDFDKAHLLEHIDDFDKSLLQFYNVGPFNGQEIRTKLIENIINDYKPAYIVETGTFLGATTEFFSKFKTKIFTIESTQLFFIIAGTRLQKYKNIQLIRGDSSNIQRLLNLDNKKSFFYLDAHWTDNLPLNYELDYANTFEEIIVCIDDFKVMENENWEYDSYQGKSLSIENFPELNKFNIFFPNYPIENETGGKRGCVFLCRGKESYELLKNLKILKQYSEI